MDNPLEDENNPTVGSSTIQVVDSSMHPDEAEILFHQHQNQPLVHFVDSESDAAIVITNNDPDMEPDQTDDAMVTTNFNSNHYGNDIQSTEIFSTTTMTGGDNDPTDSIQVPVSSVSSSQGCSPIPQAVPEMMAMPSEQPSASSDVAPDSGPSSNSLVLLFNEPCSTADLPYSVSTRFSDNVESTAEFDSELQVVPDSASMSTYVSSIVESSERRSSTTSYSREMQMVPMSTTTLVSQEHEVEVSMQDDAFSSQEVGSSSTLWSHGMTVSSTEQGGIGMRIESLNNNNLHSTAMNSEDSCDVSSAGIAVDNCTSMTQDCSVSGTTYEDGASSSEQQPEVESTQLENGDDGVKAGESTILAFDSQNGEYVDIRNLIHGEADDSREEVTYILQDDAEDGVTTSYQIVTSDELCKMQAAEMLAATEVDQHQVVGESTENEAHSQYILDTFPKGEEVLVQLPTVMQTVGAAEDQTVDKEIDCAYQMSHEDLQNIFSPADELITPECDLQENEVTEMVYTQTPRMVDLGPSCSYISPDNVEAILQILQALPFQAQGQTVQIVLQGHGQTAHNHQGLQTLEIAKDPATLSEEQVIKLISSVPAPVTKRTTTDTAVQVSPGDAVQSNYKVCTINEQVDVIQMDGTTSRASLQSSGKNRCQQKRQRGFASSRRGRSPLSSSVLYVTSDGEESGYEPGISYYTVMDYVSEPEGYSSSQDAVDAPSSSFMEDHLELQNDDEVIQGQSLLESTLDESTVVSAFRRKGKCKVLAISRPGSSIDLPDSGSPANVTLMARSYEQVTLDGHNLAEYSCDELDQFSRPLRYTRGLRTLPRRMLHRCAWCEYECRDKLLVSQHCHTEHPDNPVRVITLVPECSRRQCPYCKQRFNYAEFFQHMRYAHNDVHPYKCFYCDFQGRDRNQVKHHICKKHGKPARIVNLLRTGGGFVSNGGGGGKDIVDGKRRIMAHSEGEDSVYEYMTDEEEEGNWDEIGEYQNLVCPECKKTFKSLKYLKTHIKMHRPHRYQCGYCDYIATLEHQILKHSLRKHGTAEPRVISKELEPEKNPLISRDIDSVMRRVFSLSLRQPRNEDPMMWARKWTCPHCDYTCQFGASFRRHIRMHANLLPYKCNYCSFKGREKYYVRRHIARMHRGLPEIVVDNTAENRAGDTSTDEDYQEKGLRRRRKRKAKPVLKAVVAVGAATPPDVYVIVKEGQVMKREYEGKMDVDQMSEALLEDADQREEGINFEDYGVREGENVVCKVCGLKIHARAFQKHALKHYQSMSFGCGYCDYKMADRSKVHAHIAFQHPTMPFRILVNGKAKSQKFPCPICRQDLEVEDEKAVREHFHLHYDYKPFRCGHCTFRASSNEIILAHGTVEHGQVVDVVVLDEAQPEGLDDSVHQFFHEMEMAEEIPTRQPELILEDLEPTPAKRKRGRPPKMDRSFPITNGNRFECPVCHCSTNGHAAAIRRHLYGHFDYKPYLCGNCSFRGFTDNEVRQHSTVHGKFANQVSISDDRMPEQLETLLAEVTERMPAKTSNMSESSSLVTGEGKRWQDELAKGKCPWCEEFVGHFRPTAYRHLKTHFQCRPYRCGHCSYRGSERNEMKMHNAAVHSGEALSVIGPSIKMTEIEQGLRRYLHGRPNLLELIKAEEADEENGEVSVKDGEIEGHLGDVGENVQEIDKKNENALLAQPDGPMSSEEAEILEVKDSGSMLLVRNFKPEDGEEGSVLKLESSTSSGKSNENHSDIQVPPDLLEDVCYLLQLSCLPQDIPLTRRKLVWHRCGQCKRKFRKAGALRDHVDIVHGNDTPDYQCYYCSYWNCNKILIKNHVVSTHPGRRVLMKERNVKNVAATTGSQLRLTEDGLSPTLEITGEMPMKRKRGRPPKNVTVSVPVPPTKTALPDLGGDQTKEINVIVRLEKVPPIQTLNGTGKRGRPRKRPLPPTSTGTSAILIPASASENHIDGQSNKRQMISVQCSSTGSVNQSTLTNEKQLTEGIVKTDDVKVTAGTNELALESLEECNENLPKVLHILQLQPSSGHNIT